MNSHSVRNFDNTSKATPATILVGTTVTVAILLSGLLLTGIYQLAIAQQNTTEDVAGTTTANATHSTTENATIATTSGGSNANNASTTTSSSTRAEGEGNQSSMSQVRMVLQQVLNALQNRDTQSAKMYLDEAINDTLGWNVSNASANTSVRGTNAITSSGSQGGTPDVGDRTSAIDSNNSVRTQIDNHETTTIGNNDNDATNAGNGADINSNTVGNSPETGTRQSDQGTSECGGVTIGGTSAADDYGCNDQDAE